MSDLNEPITEDAEGSDDADSQTVGLWVNLLVGLGITLLCLLVFDPLRRRFPAIFETRRKLHEDRDPVDYLGNRVTTPPAPSHKPFGWLLPTLRLDLEKLTDTHGLDAALFLRYHRFMFALFSILLVPSSILLPVYYTGPNKNLTGDDRAAGVNIFSIGNVKTSDPWRFWLVLAIEYVIMGFVCYFLFYHFTLYCRDRRRYRSTRHPANYAVLVQDVPQGARNAEAVRNYWDRVFPGEISSVFYVHDARRLEKWKEKFWQAVTKREVAEWRLHHSHEVAVNKSKRTQAKLERRNKRLKKSRTHRSRGKHVSEPPPSVEVPSQSDEFMGKDDTEILDGMDVDIKSPTAPEAVYTSTSATDVARADVAIVDGAMADVDAMLDEEGGPDGAQMEENTGMRRRVFGMKGMKKRGPPKEPEAAVQYWETVQRKAWAKVAAYQSQRDSDHFSVTTSAIVVFKSRRSAAIAAQTNFSRKEDEWRVTRAPEPMAINWGALCVSGWTVYTRRLITALLSTSLTLFWLFPVAFIMGIVSISELVKLDIGGFKPFEMFLPILDWSPFILNVIESTFPALILSFFLGWVPNIFALFVSISRISSHAERDRQVRDWYFTFVTFSNFLFVAFAGILLHSFTEILSDPKEAVNILAKNIPKQAAFVMNLILITTLKEIPLELLQFARVITRMLKLWLSARTQRQREEAEVGDMGMDFVGFYSTSQLVSLLGLVYCTIQPFMIVVCMAYFAMTYIVFKYNLCYSYYNEYEDGGRMYGGALYAVWVGLFSHLLTMVGVFTLNGSPAQSVLIILPTVVSVMFLMHCRKSFSRVLEHGSALETQDRVEQLEGCRVDVITDELAATYEHPGWDELPKYSELENLNGVITEEDVAKAAEKEAMFDDFLTVSEEVDTVIYEHSTTRNTSVDTAMFDHSTTRNTSSIIDQHSGQGTYLGEVINISSDDDFRSVPSLTHVART